MPTRRSIVINGDLGSGKSTVSKLLSERLGIRRISVGDLYREMAQQRGMTALQLNLHAELDDKIDSYVDQLQSEIASSGEQLIVDSRLAWFFFKDALKVHLITDPAVAAVRVFGRPGDSVESYVSAEEAMDRLASRSESERTRFISRYGADKTRLRNYELVCDSSSATPDEIATRVVQTFSAPIDFVPTPMIFLDPKRIYPTDHTQASGDNPITLGYARPYFFAVDGHSQLSDAIHRGLTLVPASLLAEADEELAGGLSARQYFDAEVVASKIHDWEHAHQITLALPPQSARR